MTKAVYIIGAPATGKSTLMGAILDRLGVATGEWYMPCPVKNKEFRVEPLEDIVTGARRGTSLGITRPGGFPGTDGLGMAASPDAVRWAREHDLGPLVLGEGRRLGSVRFLSELGRAAKLLVVHLSASDEVLDARCEARGSEQSATFRRSGRTMASNTATQLELDSLATVWWTLPEATDGTPEGMAARVVDWLD